MSKPTPIQMQTWPAALCGLDVLGIAPTGSGKTLAYLLPSIPHVLGQQGSREGKAATVCLVLLPTRELAAQVVETCRGSGGLRPLFGLRCEAVYGGANKEVQVDNILTMGVPHVLAATPGRLLDLLSLSVLSLEQVSYFVLDEADRMLALGFEPQLEAISKGIRPDRQCLLFSATFPLRLREAADTWMAAPERRVLVRVATMEVGAAEAEAEEHGDDEGSGKVVGAAASRDGTGAPGVATGAPAATAASSTLTVSPTVTQTLHVCAEHKKPRKLLHFVQKVRDDEKNQAVRQRAHMLIFCNTIKTLKFVASLLVKQKHQCELMHSGIPQAKREKNLSDFKAGRTLILVATDLAARGLHIKHLKYVINYDFPSNLEQYCHRIGRTGRDGERGEAFSFFTRNLSSLAGSLASLLERCGARVDPNLKALAEGKAGAADDDREDAPEHSVVETAPTAKAAVRPAKRGAPRSAAGPDGSASSHIPPGSDDSGSEEFDGVGRGGGLRIRPGCQGAASSSDGEGEDAARAPVPVPAAETEDAGAAVAAPRRGAAGKRRRQPKAKRRRTQAQG